MKWASWVPPMIGSTAQAIPFGRRLWGIFQQCFLQNQEKTINSALPKIMPAWGRVRISNGGDSIRCAKIRSTGRDSSYVRVSLDSTRMTIEFISFFFFVIVYHLNQDAYWSMGQRNLLWTLGGYPRLLPTWHQFLGIWTQRYNTSPCAHNTMCHRRKGCRTWTHPLSPHYDSYHYWPSCNISCGGESWDPRKMGNYWQKWRGYSSRVFW